MSDPLRQIIVLGPRRRGRPRASESREAKMSLSAWVPVQVYDSLNRIANEKDVSVSALVSHVLAKATNPTK